MAHCPLLAPRGGHARGLREHQRLVPRLDGIAGVLGVGAKRGSTSSGSGSTAVSAGTSSCGPKPGVKATGTPISIGAIATKQPGTDFTDIPNMVSAYFSCVNDNGGINGHPLKLFVQFDQTQPAQIAAAAHQLTSTDHVVGIVGAFDLLECTIDQGLWKHLGMYEMDAGTAPECWSTANSAPINLEPASASTARCNTRSRSTPTRSCSTPPTHPGTATSPPGQSSSRDAAHVPITTEVENVPITDANSVALHLVNQAGPNGAVVLGFTPPEALSILQAAQKLGWRTASRSGAAHLHAPPTSWPRPWDRSGSTSCSSTPS